MTEKPVSVEFSYNGMVLTTTGVSKADAAAVVAWWRELKEQKDPPEPKRWLLVMEEGVIDTRTAVSAILKEEGE